MNTKSEETKSSESPPSTNNRLTRPGPIRLGNAYQDAQAVDFIVEWLEDPTCFKEIKLEAPDAGSLDDIQLIRLDGTLEVWQVKYSTNPHNVADELTWKTLLSKGAENGQPGVKKRGVKRTSLLQKWFTSWHDLEANHSISRSGLLSNRRPSPEILAVMDGQKVIWDKIPATTRTKIIQQLGSEESVQEFFDQFIFDLKKPNLEALRDGAWRRFASRGGTLGGWNRLEDAVRRWATVPGSLITLPELYSISGLKANPVRLRFFLPPSDYFAKYLEPHDLFHHNFPLVGRRSQLKAMCDFVAGTKQIAILPGRGGIGKSRLLFGLCRRLARCSEDLPVRIAIEEIEIKPDTIVNELPDASCLVIVDDAHRRKGIENLLAAAQQNPALKVLLSTRPQSTESLEAEVRSAGFSSGKIEVYEPLKDLNGGQIRRLARYVLGREWAGYSYKLANVTRDCPLLTVLGGQLIREHEIAPDLLSQNETFRKEVLMRFRDIRIGEAVEKLPRNFPRDLCKRVLPLIAVTSPLQSKDDALMEKVAALAETNVPTLRELLDALVKVGAVARGGHLARIIPDVLSDYILQDACFTDDGSPTGWAVTVFEALSKTHLDTVLRNLAELDWRIRTVSTEYESESYLLNKIWDDIETRFRQSNCAGRISWLGLFSRLSFMQAERLWRIVDIAVNEPAVDDKEDEDEYSVINKRWRLSPRTQLNVLATLPPVLQGIAHDARFTGRCVDLLWELGRNQQRVSNHPSGALDILINICSHEEGKPDEFDFILLERCGVWMSDPEIHSYKNSILAVLSSLLSRSRKPKFSKGRWLNYGRLPLPPNHFRVLRTGALDLVKQCALDGPRTETIEALGCLCEIIGERTLWGCDEKEREFWEVEQLFPLDIVSRVAAKHDDPFVRLSIWRALHDQAAFGSRVAVRNKARAIWDAIPDTFEMQFIRVFTRHHYRDEYFKSWKGDEIVVDEREFISDKRRNYAALLCQNVVSDWVHRNPLPVNGFIALEKGLIEIESSGWLKENELGLKGNDFLLKLGLDFPDYAIGLCQAALSLPESPIAYWCYDLLFALRCKDSNLSLPLVHQFMSSGHRFLLAAVAESYSFRGRSFKLLDEEYDIVQKLLSVADIDIRRAAARILPTVVNDEPRRALEILLETEIGSDTKLAVELFGIFDPYHELEWSLLTPAELETLLQKLIIVENIEDYGIGCFLLNVCLQNPILVAQMLVRRVERKSQLHRASYEVQSEESINWEIERAYEPLPSIGFHDEKLKMVAEHPEYPDALRLIRDASPNIPHHWNDDLAYLFRDFSLAYNKAGLDVLNEWIDSGDCAKLREVTRLLGAGYLGFYAENIEFLGNYLKKAENCGYETFGHVEHALLRNAEHGPARAIASHRGERSLALISKSQETLEEVGKRSAALIKDSQEALESAHNNQLVISFFQELLARGEEMRRAEKERSDADEIYFRS